MNLPSAITRIQQSFTRMNDAYGQEIFDEIAIIGPEGKGRKLHYYDGLDQPAFMKNFADKTNLLRKELAGEKTESGGEFGFTREGEGDSFDAYICLGPEIYLFCNNSKQSMHEITQDSRWLEAQSHFLNASQYFAADPVQID